MKQYYFDHAASSWPKPPDVIEEMARAVTQYAANPGRGSHAMAMEASRILLKTRVGLAKLFNIGNPNDIFFMPNTTYALNQAIKGFLQQGDHVITTMIEHNSVRRPLEFLKRSGVIELTYLPVSATGVVDFEDLHDALRPETKLFACSHGSNLLGTILPIAEISEVVKKNGVKILVDAAQTAGTYPLDVKALGIDMLAFPGHKGLLGPQGTGGLYIDPSIELTPLVHGGTGSRSEDIDQPATRPDRYESGTVNTPGIAGLGAGIHMVLAKTPELIHEKEWELTQRMMEGLQQIEAITLLGPAVGQRRGGVCAFLLAGFDAAELAFKLDREYGIAVRAGLHCTPLGHDIAGTLKTGAVRASIGFYTTEAEVDYFVQSVKEVARPVLLNGKARK